MASRRQLKKINRRTTKRLALQKLKELEMLQVEEAEIEKEIQRLKRVIEGKKSTLSQLKASLANLNSISLRAQQLAVEATQAALPLEVAQTQLADSARSYVAIKKYHDYVDRGIIQEQSILDKYQIQDFMERIMNQEEYDEYITESIEKGEDLLRKDAERQMRRAEERSRYTF